MGAIRFILMMKCPSIALNVASVYRENVLTFFHRKDAEGAEDNNFMLAVDPAGLRDGYPGKHKDRSTL
jgi:hypothetical protein